MLHKHESYVVGSDGKFENLQLLTNFNFPKLNEDEAGILVLFGASIPEAAAPSVGLPVHSYVACFL